MDEKIEKTEKSESTFIPLLDNEKIAEPKNEKSISFRNTNYRYLFLLFACLLRFGRNYCYDNPQALQDQFQDKTGDFKLTGIDYNLLNGVYSFPNIILPLCGGIITDKLGGRLGVLIFAFLLIIGQFFFLIGAQFSAFWLLLFGRVIFGLGGETLCVVQNTIVATWFGEKELGFALGMDILVARLGGTLNSWLTPYLFKISSSFFLPLFSGLILCVCSFFCGLAMFHMDRESDIREGVVQRSNQSEIPVNPMELRDLKKFDGRFWMLVVNCMMVYGAFFAFTGNANSILCNFFGMESDTAGVILIFFYLSSACATPLFGMLADRIGKRSFSIVVSGLIYIAAIFILLYLPNDSSYGMILLPMILTGIFYSWYASSFFPCIPLIVEKNMIGTAFGLVVSFENLNLSIAPIIFGAIHDHSEGISYGYYWPLIYVVGQMGVGLLSALAVYLIDRRKNNILQLGMNEAKNFLKG